MKKNPLIFIIHILDSIKNVEIFMKNIPKEVFIKHREKQNAVIREIEIIGEAVANIPKEFRDAHPEISWKEIVGTRDKMIHHYFGVNLDIVWDIIKKDLPELKLKILRIKQDLEKKDKQNAKNKPKRC